MKISQNNKGFEESELFASKYDFMASPPPPAQPWSAPCTRGLWGAMGPIYVKIRTVPAGTSSACEVEPEVLGLSFLVVYQMSVRVMMLMSCKREPGPGVSGGTPYLFPELRALGPLRAHNFWRLHSCIIFRDDLLHNFFHVFSMDFDLHFSSMLASFSVSFALFFWHRFYMDLSSIL